MHRPQWGAFCVAAALAAGLLAAAPASAEPKPAPGATMRSSAKRIDLADIRKRRPSELIVTGDRTAPPRTKPDTSPSTDCAAVKPDPAVADDSLVACARVVPFDARRLPAPNTPKAPKLRNGPTASLAVTNNWDLLPDSGPIPSYCGTQPGEEDSYERLRECHAGSIVYTIYRRPENIPLGNIWLTYWEWEELSNKRRTWTHNIRMFVSDVDGLALETTYLHGQGWCSLQCVVAEPEEKRLVRLARGQWLGGSWDMARSGGPDRDTVYGSADTDLNFLNVLTGETKLWTDIEFRNRCDSTLAETPAEGGCVFDGVIPELVLDKSETSRHRLHALFVEDAQRTTPDHYGARNLSSEGEDPKPLRRLIDKERQEANYRASCGTFVPDPDIPEDSCDEYPYQSTYQGAAEIGRDRTAVGHVPLPHNSAGGRRLGPFYTANRVIDKDPFWVAVEEGSGGSGGGPGRDRPPTVNAGDDVSGTEGSAIDLGGSANDAQGPPAVSWSYAPAGPVDPGTVCTFSNPDGTATSFTCNDDGSFTVTLTADDGVNMPVSDTLVATVRNVAPRFGRAIPMVAPAAAAQAAADGVGPDPWSVYRAGTTVGVTMPYQDPGGNDTQTCTIDWDEGTAAEVFTARSSNCDRPHVYRHAGMYTINVTITDDDGASTDWTTMVVVYDPDAGAVNLDAATATPAGALVGGPDPEQWTWAHLTARYYPAQVAPVGEAKAWIPQSSFRVEPTSRLQWLVVTRDGKVAAKGTSTTATGTSVGFVLYGYRGCALTGPDCQAGPDRMRLVVWPLSAGPNPGAEITYDNQPTAGYDIDVVRPLQLTAGSVQIHQ